MSRFDGMTVHDLRVVATLSEVLHFGRTAEVLGVAQPSVSTSVGKFEALVGEKVFYRTSRRCEVTPVGEPLIGRVKEALAQIELLDTKDQGDFAGTLRLGIIPTMAPYLLPKFMELISASFPRLSIYFTEAFTERLLDEVTTHQLDVGIISTFERRKGIEAHLLFEEPLVLAVNESHPLAHSDEVSLDSLSLADALLLDKGNCLRDQALKVCGSDEVCERPSHSTSLATLLYLVSAGFGYTVIPQMAAGVAGEVSRVAIRPLCPAPKREIMLVHRAGDSRRHHYLRLRDLAQEMLAQKMLVA